MTETKYEIIFLIYPHLSQKIHQIAKKYLTILDGTINHIEYWGKRKLAYQIKKLNQANFLYININCLPANVLKLKKETIFDKDIMRHLVLKEYIDQLFPTSMIDIENKEENIKLWELFNLNIEFNIKNNDHNINYKNLPLISNNLSETKSIIASKRHNAKQKRDIASAIKTARFISLLPYCDNHND